MLLKGIGELGGGVDYMGDLKSLKKLLSALRTEFISKEQVL